MYSNILIPRELQKKKPHEYIYIIIIGHQNGEGKENLQLWEYANVLIKAVLTQMTM